MRLSSLRWVSAASALSLSGIACQSGDDDVAAGTGGPTVETIGPEGGEATSEDGILTIVIPEGALISPIEVVIEESFDAPASIGPAFRVQPDLDIGEDLTAIYRYGLVDIGDANPDFLGIAVDGGGFWEPLERLELDTAAMTVSSADGSISFHYGLIQDSSFGDDDDDADGSTTEDSADTTAGDPDDSGDTTSSPDTGDTTAGDSGSTTGSDTGSGSESGDTSDGGETTGTDSGGDTDSGSTSGATGSGTTDGGSTDGGSTDGGGTTGGPDTCDSGGVDIGEVCLLEGITVSVGDAPAAVLLEDLDGDSELDLVVANQSDATISVRRGTGTGFFLVENTYDAGGLGPSSLALANLDGGDQLDLVVGNQIAQDVAVLLGGGDATFGDPFNVAADAAVLGVAAGSFDDDGVTDVVAVAGTDLLLFVGLGDGTLADYDAFDLGAIGNDIAVEDFSPSDLDVVIPAGNEVLLLAGNGMGLFGAPNDSGVLGTANALTVAQLSDDANPDVAAVSSSDVVTVLLGNGVGGFGGGIPFATGANPVDVAAADLTGDGEMDLVVLNADDETVTVLEGDGTGSFDPVATFAVGNSPTALAVGELNGDGATDVVVTNLADDAVSLLISNP